MSLDRQRLEAVGLLRDLGWHWDGVLWHKTVTGIDDDNGSGTMASMTDEVKRTADEEPRRSGAMYLGDGVYVSFDGMHIVLSTEREDGEHVIYLDGYVFKALVDYVGKITGCAR